MSSTRTTPYRIETCHWQGTGRWGCHSRRTRGNRVGTAVSQELLPSGSSQACNSQDLGHKGQTVLNKRATRLSLRALPALVTQPWTTALPSKMRGGVVSAMRLQSMTSHSLWSLKRCQLGRNFFSNQRPERRVSSNNRSLGCKLDGKNHTQDKSPYYWLLTSCEICWEDRR